jgi:hypothetical protein
MTLAARQQQIEHPSEVRSAIDIVSQKDVDRRGRRMRLEVSINLREQLSQQIGTAVHVTDGIHSQTFRGPTPVVSPRTQARSTPSLPLSENALFDYRPVDVK